MKAAKAYVGHVAFESKRKANEVAWMINRASQYERDECAKLVEGMKMQEILLAAGEMTAQERRTVRALQTWLAHKIRTRNSHAAAGESASLEAVNT